MRILFYQPYNQIVVYIESVAEQFSHEGHEIFFLSHTQHGETHKNFEKFGAQTFSTSVERKNFIHYYWNRVLNLSKFCRSHHIDIVYSHFQEANLIAVLAQYFCKSKFVITRHHSDCAFLDNNIKEKWGDKVINLLAKIYIATSNKVWRQMVKVEGTDPRKVRLISYGYNFNAFAKVSDLEVDKIRMQFSATILLVMAARFIPEKRHHDLIYACKVAIEEGIDLKLLLLGTGPLHEESAKLIVHEGMEDRIFLLGFKLNIMDYYAAADMVVHFSYSEASNSAIKEAGLTGTTVAVCKDVGDFDDYIVDGENGFLLDKEHPDKDFMKIISRINKNEFNLSAMGLKLKSDVSIRFDINNVKENYTTINQQLIDGNI